MVDHMPKSDLQALSGFYFYRNINWWIGRNNDEKSPEFKNHLQSVFDILFYAARSQVLLTKAAAEECLAALSKFLGIY